MHNVYYDSEVSETIAHMHTVAISCDYCVSLMYNIIFNIALC